MKRRLSRKTLRYRITHNSVVALIIIALKKLRKRDMKVHFSSKYHYEKLMKEYDPRRNTIVGKSIEQINEDRNSLDILRESDNKIK